MNLFAVSMIIGAVACLAAVSKSWKKGSLPDQSYLHPPAVVCIRPPAGEDVRGSGKTRICHFWRSKMFSSSLMWHFTSNTEYSVNVRVHPGTRGCSSPHCAFARRQMKQFHWTGLLTLKGAWSLLLAASSQAAPGIWFILGGVPQKRNCRAFNIYNRHGLVYLCDW